MQELDTILADARNRADIWGGCFTDFAKKSAPMHSPADMLLDWLSAQKPEIQDLIVRAASVEENTLNIR